MVGLGGVGKTQVALQMAYWIKEHKAGWSVFWLPALSIEYVAPLLRCRMCMAYQNWPQ